MGTPLISFIITYHNEPPVMLSECIESVLALSPNSDEREIIVVDDGSKTDMSVLLNNLYKDNSDSPEGYIYIRQENQGISAARNKGLRIARGEYIQFVDADDLIIAHHYEHCIKVLRSEKPDVVSFGFSRKMRGFIKYNDSTLQNGADYMSRHKMYGPVWCYLFRRFLSDGLYFKEGKRYSEDEEFTALLMIRAGKTCHTEAPAYLYRKNAASATRHNDIIAISRRLDNQLDTIITLHNQLPILSVQQQQGMERRVAQLTMDYLYNTIIWKHVPEDLAGAISQLKHKGLYPLPANNYSLKYNLFRRLLQSEFGQYLLLHVLPFYPIK